MMEGNKIKKKEIKKEKRGKKNNKEISK